ncbi:hypothetical protein GCM10009727_52250 [Actinomadura napierensis]|uniref:Tetratricopeptide repeat protein n=1 Tax=Actinomadura napierensis TaxID=267854 RepID=A0ABN2ZWG2_9ACTN
MLFYRAALDLLTYLGDTAVAWAAQQQALALCPSHDFTDHTLCLLDRTLCLTRDGDITEGRSQRGRCTGPNHRGAAARHHQHARPRGPRHHQRAPTPPSAGRATAS